MNNPCKGTFSSETTRHGPSLVCSSELPRAVWIHLWPKQLKLSRFFLQTSSLNVYNIPGTAAGAQHPPQLDFSEEVTPILRDKGVTEHPWPCVWGAL